MSRLWIIHLFMDNSLDEKDIDLALLLHFPKYKRTIHYVYFSKKFVYDCGDSIEKRSGILPTSDHRSYNALSLYTNQLLKVDRIILKKDNAWMCAKCYVIFASCNISPLQPQKVGGHGVVSPPSTPPSPPPKKRK